ncbi:30S ribosomal protein S4e [uncultured archaeon]|nr:30S ribosomal protein S4e [uncultured archaeon]
MANKGNSRHMKRLALSSYPNVGRKTAPYLAKPTPGRHYLGNCVALVVALRDKLNLAANEKEAKRIVVAKQIEVNGKTVTDEKYPIGFGDVITLKPTGESYKVSIGKKGVIKIDKSDKTISERTQKVVGKYAVKGNKLMIRLLDGSVLAAGKDVSVNDSVVIAKNAIKKTLKFEKGAKCFVIGGTHASETGTIKEISKGSAVRSSIVKVENGENTFETLVDNVIVVGA